MVAVGTPEAVVVRTVAVRMDAVRMDAVRMPEGVEAVPDSSQVEGHIPEVHILEAVEAGHTEHMAGSSLQREIEIQINGTSRGIRYSFSQKRSYSSTLVLPLADY